MATTKQVLNIILKSINIILKSIKKRKLISSDRKLFWEKQQAKLYLKIIT